MAFCYKPLSVFLATSLILSFLATICLVSLSEAARNGGIIADLIHRDSLLSPFYDPFITRFGRSRRLFSRSFSRQSSLKSMHLKPNSKSPEATLTPIVGEYLMKIRIGTPPIEILAIADTGSDLTWTQCVPCPECYQQKAPLFDPKKSSTYKNVSCKSQECQDLGFLFSDCDDTGNTCEYDTTYGDGSTSSGDFGAETFTFDSTSSANVAFSNIRFGCGHDNFGTFNEMASGIIGLGGGSVSIVRQLEKSIGARFAYCFTPLESNVSSNIYFGSGAIVTGPKVVSTPLVKKSPNLYYYLTLEAISVGNKRLEYTFINSNESVEEGNIVIDSGTPITFLPKLFYEKLESLLVKSINSSRISDPRRVSKLCYKLPSNGVFNSPPITAHFKGADVVLPHENTFIEVEKGVVCLTLVPTYSLSVFGNLHQVNYLIGYDLESQKLDFLPTDCSKRSS